LGTNDKARAVVDAMERDMATTIATKADLQLLEQKLTAVINEKAAEARQESALIRKDLEILSTTMTVRMGSMLVVAMGVLFAALKLT
jgi:predicted Holliday junction resolvase-like endonuclease